MKFFGIGVLAIQASAVLGASHDSPYVPYHTSCPSSDFNLVRTADSLSQGEQDFLQKRDSITRDVIIDWLGKSNLSNFDARSFLGNKTIRYGLAFSGGGYRAMLAGAGQLAAADNRTDHATDNGHIGGLLQGATYLAGLSGGNWLVGSIVVNNFTSVQALQNDGKLWNIEHSLIAPGGVNIIKTFSYWDDIIDDVEDKKDAGWNTSLTDLWGRGLGYQFFNASKGGRGLQYSAIRDYDVFKNAEMPFPVHVTDHRKIGTQIISLNSSVFEFNPFEIGSWDPNTYHFADLRYVASDVNDGKPTSSNSSGACATNYDNVGFMIGTSATLFNQFILRLNTTGLSGEVYKLAQSILGDLGRANDDVSIFDPNPFYGIDGVVDSDDRDLTLVDGGEDNENIPLVPLYQPQREVDLIFAFDNSADTEDSNPLGGSWPDGASLVATYERQFDAQANGTHFPYVPDTNTFVWGGLTLQPTFFGCNLTNLSSLYNDSAKFNTSDPSNIPPVIVYIANAEHSFASNESTFKLSYSNKDRDAMIENGYNTFSQNNGTLDSEWRSCIGCALVLREQQRRNQTPTDQCQRCFSKYCWDGSTVGNSSSTPKRRDGKSNIVNTTAVRSAASASASASASSTGKKKKKNGAALNTVSNGALASVFALFFMLL